MEKKSLLSEHKSEIFEIITSVVFLVLALIIKNSVSNLVLYLISIIIAIYPIIINGIKGICNKSFLDENTLMVIASITSFIIGNRFEGVFIALLFRIGEMLEDVATDSSKRKIASLSELENKTSRVIVENEIKEINSENVEIGSLIQVRKGEKIPIDGILETNNAELDCKAITGESKIFNKNKGEKIYSGSVNVGDEIIIKTTKQYCDSTAQKIISLVNSANQNKANSQKFITSFSKVYTPIVVCLALLVAVLPPLFDSFNFNKWIYKALSFLVISCPCALVISVPLGYFVGIGNLAKSGVLVKGSVFIDKLSNVKNAVFDKTGTLTYGEFEIEKIKSINNFSLNEILSCAKSLEKSSTHPIAKAINNYNCDIELKTVKNLSEIAGNGISGEIENKKVKLGNFNFVCDNKTPEKEEYAGTILYLSINGSLEGKIYLRDKIKEDCFNLVKELKHCGVNKTYILSGDNELTTNYIKEKVKIDYAFYGLMPDEKLAKIKELQENGNCVYVGDGINDAPSIKQSDIGIAMGGLGSDIAIETADIVIMDDKISKLPFIIKRAKKIKRKVIENIVFSILVKFSIMLLGIFIDLPVFIAMIGDVGVMLLAVINSLII